MMRLLEFFTVIVKINDKCIYLHEYCGEKIFFSDRKEQTELDYLKMQYD